MGESGLPQTQAIQVVSADESSTTPEAASRVSKQDTLLRAFFALWPDADTARILASRQTVLGGKKSMAADFHLTLAFLGSQPEALLPVFDQIGQGLILPDCPLIFDCYGVFAKKKVVWAGLSSIPAQLLRLQRDLLAALKKHGIAVSHEEHFIPHITLARQGQLPAEQVFNPVICKNYHLVLAGSNAPEHRFGSATPRYQLLRHYGAVHID